MEKLFRYPIRLAIDWGAWRRTHVQTAAFEYGNQLVRTTLQQTAGRLRRVDGASSSSWPAQAGHPRLAVLISAEGVDGDPAAAMKIKQRPCVSTCLRFAVIAVLMCVMRQTFAACPAPPPAIVAIPGVAYYTDARHSVRDQTLFQLNREALKSLDRYLVRIAHMSDAFLRGDGEAGRCTFVWLMAWAKEGALLGEPMGGTQARSQRRWSAAAMILSALKVWDAASEENRVILPPYIRRLAQAVQWDTTTDKLRNNLLYWAGLVYMVSARLIGDAQLFNQAVIICRDAIASFTPQGSLPLEDLRGDRAIDYNGFALFPLSVIATLSGNESGCSTADLRPLARYVLAHRAHTSDPFLRWAPFMQMDIALEPEVLFYSYGGGSLHLAAEKLSALARAGSP